MRAILILAVVLSLLIPAEAGPKPEVRSDMLVSTAALEAKLSDPWLVVLHVGRDRKQYDAGHIPGARYVAPMELMVGREGLTNELPPLDDLAALVRRLGISQRSRIVIYGEDAGLLAARAYVTLDYLGLGKRAALLDGHLPKWKAEGRKLTQDEPKVAPSDFTPRARPELVVGEAEVRKLSAARSAAIIDARPEDEYAGQKAGDGVARAGHIPGAASVFWKKNVVSDENPVMRPAEELRAMYAAAGAKPGGVVVTYCRSGVQASHAYFTAKYLGYDARLYDGSFLEWSANKQNGVEK